MNNLPGTTSLPRWPVYFLTGVALIIMLVSGYAQIFDRELLEYLILEDGVLENLTALLLFLGGGFVFYHFFKNKNDKGIWWKIFHVVFGLTLWFGFAEEISWGQRIVGFDTPVFFQKHNKQYEVGIHNLIYGGFSVNRWIFSFGLSIGIAVYYLFFRLLTGRVAWIGNWTKRLGVPVPKWNQTLLLLASVLLILFIDHGKKWEIFECIFVLVFMITLYEGKEEAFGGGQ